MIPIIDFEKRTLNGPRMTAGDFDDFLMETSMELVEKYDLNFDLDTIIADDERADAVFNAAVEFLAKVGVFNRSAGQVIQWTEEEIREMAVDYKTNPRTLVVGAGKEQHTITARMAGDGKVPVIWAGGGPLFNAQLIEASITAYTKEPAVKGFTKAGGVSKVGNVDARADAPSEVYVQMAETDAQIAALKKVGREGMFLGNINATAPSAGGMCVRPGRYDPKQCMMGVHIAPEQKIDYSRLHAAMLCEDLGVAPWASAMSMMGGLAGGPGGSAMCATANMLAQLSYAHSPWSSVAIADMKGSSKTAMTLATLSAVLRAAERNLNLPTGVPCCDSTVTTCFEEGIIGGTLIAVVAAASGVAINWLTGTSPLCVRIQEEAMRAVVGLSAQEAEVIVHKLLDLMKQVQEEHAGQSVLFPQRLFFSIYDLKTLQPKPEFKTAAENAVRLMREAGLPLADTLSLD